MESITKPRNQNQCREWEKQRRNKFNDAITKLGEIVKTISKSGKEADVGKTVDTVKYPKIEIVQKAIVCLTNSAQEKTQLKADILALQVELEKIKEIKSNRKDATTQVKSNRTTTFVKLLKNKNVKQSDTKENNLPTKQVTINNKRITRVNKKAKLKVPVTSKMPMLLPQYNLFPKKVPENTIVVLPAAPYIFPQRPFLLPSMPPAIVVVDNNLQALNKAVPIVSRNGGDITKTTMVNILPISAYSRPLSASKQKKSNVKLKSDAKKPAKKIKALEKKKELIQSNETSKSVSDEPPTKESKPSNPANENNVSGKVIETVPASAATTLQSSPVIPTPIKKDSVDTPSNDIDKETVTDSLTKPKETEPSITTGVIVKTVIDKSLTPKTIDTNSITAKSDSKDITKNDEINKPSNKVVLKELSSEDKDKENKLTNMLDSTLDNVVDVGNARLELAEEFLAASPTAAFLMSFPLVSGNRADSPADEPQSTNSTTLANPKDITQKRHYIFPQSSSTSTFFEKTNNSDVKMKATKTVVSTAANKQNELPKYISSASKSMEPKVSTAVSGCNVSNENPFLTLPMPSLASTTCTLSDTTFGLDFESNLHKPTTSSYASNNNIFYKNDPFSTAKSTIYSTSSITSNHDFNGIGLYPCAMEKYAPKNKPDFTNIDDSMKMGSSRLTYDIDLGWSHKSFDFVSCTSNTTFAKDNIMTTVTASTPFCTSYNPFNTEFHVPLVSASNKKDSVPSKPNFADSLTSFYPQHNFWPEEPFYNNTNVSKNLPSKHQNYPLPAENGQGISHTKPNNPKQYEVKGNSDTNVENRMKSTNNAMSHQTNEKYTKKSPSKMHINWMTSEIRPMQTAYNPLHTEMKESHKIPYNHVDHTTNRNEHNETNNYFPISMHNFPTQPLQDEFQVWPSARPLGTTEISIDPPPINLPTLVGDLALGPHDKKKSLDPTNRSTNPQQDLQNCSNFFSVTQLMNRSTENVTSRYQPTQVESLKPIVTKHNITHYSNDSNRKTMAPRIENHASQSYIFNNSKLTHPYENMAQFSQNKSKTTNKSDKNEKSHKNNYSAEALLRGGNCTQKIQDHTSKFLMPPQKYNDFNIAPDSSVAQVSHFPPIIDYSENSYTGQQFSGTSLYNATTNTLSNSFYSNFMPGSSNLMSSNYSSGPFTGEFMDYNQSSECNFTNHKYEDLKMRNNPSIFQADKMPTNYKSITRRESAAKHKLECSKKESSKKYQSKRGKLNSDVGEWSESSHPLWQNKSHNKRNANLMTEELPFPNYASNQVHSQYQPEFFNGHLMPSNMQAAGPNVDRSISSIPITSRANFNLSTIFPEITMKVQ